MKKRIIVLLFLLSLSTQAKAMWICGASNKNYADISKAGWGISWANDMEYAKKHALQNCSTNSGNDNKCYIDFCNWIGYTVF